MSAVRRELLKHDETRPSTVIRRHHCPQNETSRRSYTFGADRVKSAEANKRVFFVKDPAPEAGGSERGPNHGSFRDPTPSTLPVQPAVGKGCAPDMRMPTQPIRLPADTAHRPGMGLGCVCVSAKHRGPP